LKNKILVSYGTDEANLLQKMEKEKVVPSKNEALRRGLQAEALLVETNETILLRLLIDALRASKSSIADKEKLAARLLDAQALSYALHAISIVKKGSAAAEFMDVFTSTLREYSLLADASIYDMADKGRLQESLTGLIVLAKNLVARSEGLKTLQGARSTNMIGISKERMVVTNKRLSDLEVQRK
jgi:hypothetical protein